MNNVEHHWDGEEREKNTNKTEKNILPHLSCSFSLSCCMMQYTVKENVQGKDLCTPCTHCFVMMKKGNWLQCENVDVT